MSALEWTMAGGLAGWAAARLAAADRWRYPEAWAVPLLSFTPQVTAGAWAGALLIRGRGARVTAGLAGATLTAAMAPRALPRVAALRPGGWLTPPGRTEWGETSPATGFGG